MLEDLHRSRRCGGSGEEEGSGPGPLQQDESDSAHNRHDERPEPPAAEEVHDAREADQERGCILHEQQVPQARALLGEGQIGVGDADQPALGTGGVLALLVFGEPT